MDQSVSIIFLFSSILIFGGLLFAAISLTKKTPRALDQDKYRSRWMTIEGKLQQDAPDSHTLCVLDADKLLDQALREKGIAGKTMGDRMKQCQGKWTNGNGVWAAHKLRNRIAHETDVRIDYTRAKQALGAYKQGLKDIGAL